MKNRSGEKFRIKSLATVKKLSAFGCCLLLLFTSACSELEKPKPEKFYSDSTPPKKQEFRWSNGEMPKSFDPAKASAPPETDIVRAIYDGLTETETKNLQAIPSIAHKWSSADDNKTWTFKLRQDAKWSNGDGVTANDFVRSWKRLAKLGEEVPHHELLKNIVGMNVELNMPVKKKEKSDLFSLLDTAEDLEEKKRKVTEKIITTERSDSKEKIAIDKVPLLKDDKKIPEKEPKKAAKQVQFGVKAIGKYTLEVSLIKPDKSFPALVAHPIFRPVFANGEEFETDTLNADIVTNGAFRIFSVGNDGITLDRAEYYYNKESVKLQRVRFVPIKDAETALKAYKDGEVDAVTNAKFEPLALKILAPFIDFRTETHSAINLYEFNRKKEPFNDRRVRQALSISIDRKRLTEDELDGASRPAYNYLPFKKKEKEEKSKAALDEEFAKAKDLMRTAGYAEGKGFPAIKLVINRNNEQQRIAKSVAKMWKQNLNIDTDIVIQEFDELESSREFGEYDLIRRGVVLPTSDETANMLAIFSPKANPNLEKVSEKQNNSEAKIDNSNNLQNSNMNVLIDQQNLANRSTNSSVNNANENFADDELKIDIGVDEQVILTDAEAALEVPAIPLYFPTSYSLVKPYVEGFEMNTLDAPLLKDVRIDNNWQPEKTKDES